MFKEFFGLGTKPAKYPEESKPKVETSEPVTETIEVKKKDIFPGSVWDISTTKYLGGSSGVEAGYFNGNLLVVKKARKINTGWSDDDKYNIEQVQEEYVTDKIYEAMGFLVPESRTYEDGKYKI